MNAPHTTVPESGMPLILQYRSQERSSYYSTGVMNAPHTTAQESRTPRILQTRVSDTLYATILESETHLILHHRNRETTPLILPYHSLDNPHRTAPELKHPSYWQYPSPEYISCYTLDLVTPLCGHTTVRNTPHTQVIHLIVQYRSQ